MNPWDKKRKMDAVRAAEDAGVVADSIEVRKRIVAMMEAGEISLEQAQKEIKRIKRGAASKGMTTRNRVFRQS